MMRFNFSDFGVGRIRNVNSFKGVNFSDIESGISDSFSADAQNMYVTPEGVLKKRTGFKCVLDAGESVNGIYEYDYADMGIDREILVIHAGCSVYLASYDSGSITLGDSLYDGLEDKKSSGFVFGGALYIIGAGYFRLSWDEHFRSLAFGKVEKTGSDATYDAVCVSGREKDSHDFSKDTLPYFCAESRFKKAVFKTGTYKTDGTEKLYIAPTEISTSIRVCALYLDYNGVYLEISPYQYKTESDEYGLFVRLDRINTEVYDKYYNCTPYILFTYNKFVYAPTNIVSRKPVNLGEMGRSSTVDPDAPKYTGEMLESFNVAAPIRVIEFDYKNTEFSEECIRCYLESRYTNGYVSRVSIDGVVCHSYLGKNSSGEVEYILCSGNGYVDIRRSYIHTNFSLECTIRIEYVCNVEKMEFPLRECGIFSFYGGNNDTRVFLSGSGKYPCRDYASYLYDATYFPDDSYTDVGNDRSRIVGYHKISGYQVIIKDGENGDSTQYLRSFSLDENGKSVFKIVQGASSYGACAPSSFAKIGDVMLFLGKEGVLRLRSTDVENQTNITLISHEINEKLCKLDISHSICGQYKNKYYIFIGDEAFVFDVFRSAWYYYNSLPTVSCFFTCGDYLFMGSSDGKIYRFMKSEEENAYYDFVSEDGSVSDARAIDAYWQIPQTNFGVWERRKNIYQVNVYIIPHKRTSMKLYYNTEYEHGWLLDEQCADIFDFSDIDFNRFTFNTQTGPRCICVDRRVNNVNSFGLRIQNNTAGEPLEICGAVIRYKLRRYFK